MTDHWKKCAGRVARSAEELKARSGQPTHIKISEDVCARLSMGRIKHSPESTLFLAAPVILADARSHTEVIEQRKG